MLKKSLSLKAGSVKKVLVGTVLLILFVQCVFFPAPSIPADRYRRTVASKVSHVYDYVTSNNYDVFVYYVGGKRGEYHTGNMSDVIIHEKFLLKYDTLYPVDPEHCKFMLEHPVFIPGEVTGYTYGTLKKLSGRHQGFEFTYTVLGKEYEKTQELALVDMVRNHPQMVNGAEFLVEYWVKNPDRAILYMDKPKKDSMSFPVSPDIHVLRPVWDSIPVLLPNPRML
jgi:hypothetical protein